MKKSIIALVLALVFTMSCTTAFADEEKVSLQFLFPVQLGGAAANTIETFVSDFEVLNPNVDIEAVFCGNYSDTLTKLTLALESGDAPQLVILDQRLLTLMSMDAVVCLDDYIMTDGGDALLDDFYPGYLLSGQYNGSQYALPFQRSVLAMYYNKDHFRAAGLDPENPPQTWDELLADGAKLTTKNEDGTVAHWGVMISNNSNWAQQSMCISASPDSSNTFNANGNEVYYNTDAVKKALQYTLDLAAAGASPEGVVDEGTMPAAFIEGAVSMIAVSSGNLTNINNSVDFDYGVCLMPACATEHGASIGGGGDLYMIKSANTTQAQYDAAWKFIRYFTEPENQARWSVATGYIASRISAKDTETMKNYFGTVAQASVMYEQLNYAFQQTSVFASAEVGEIFQNMFTSVALGEATIDDATAYAQESADYVLADYR